MTEFELQGVTISINGGDLVAKTLLSDFADLRPSTSDVDITFTITPGFTDPPDRGTRINENVWVGKNSVFIDERREIPNEGLNNRIRTKVGQIGYQVHIRRSPSDRNPEVKIRYDSTITKRYNRIAHPILRLQNWSYMSRPEIVAKNITYGIFEPIVHQQLLEKGGAFVHASSVHKQGEAVAFPAWGGAGKTSLSGELIRNEGCQFLSDDLALVSDDGKIEPYTKSVVVYPYNVIDDDTARSALLNGRSIFDRYQWSFFESLHGKKGVRRRITPDLYYDTERFPDDFSLSKVIFLVRHEGDAFEVESASPENLAQRATSTIANELSPYFVEYVTSIHAAEPDHWPSLEQLLSESTSVYESAFETSESKLLHIPVDATPGELAAFVSKNVL